VWATTITMILMATIFVTFVIVVAPIFVTFVIVVASILVISVALSSPAS
jgi:hypothetical protein